MSISQPQRPVRSQPEKIETHMCKHPRVQIVSREEDAEYVECVECGEIFESSEFKDMAIEEQVADQEEA